ncbi:MAG TPA: hypothetical protein VGV38_13515 [Pyrinomonadaceae bacterium]|nr:hypothetical protein [Pyrinomonadaceae bacterium]
MKAEGLKQELRLRLLALVLALALTWYALNPAPGPVRRGPRAGDEPPEGERREAKPFEGGAVVGVSVGETRASASPVEWDADELEWPELIDVD